MNMNPKQMMWLWAGVGGVVLSVSPQRSMAQCNSYERTYTSQRVRVDYGPAYRGTAATHTVVEQPVDVVYRNTYVQPVRQVTTVVRREPVYAPVIYDAPVVAYDDYAYPTRRYYRSSHYGYGVRSYGHHGYRYRGHGYRSRRGHRRFGLSFSTGRGYYGHRRSGISFSYHR